MPTIFEALQIEPQPILIELQYMISPESKELIRELFEDGDAALLRQKQIISEKSWCDVDVVWADGWADSDCGRGGPVELCWALVWWGLMTPEELDQAKRDSEKDIPPEVYDPDRFGDFMSLDDLIASLGLQEEAE